MERQDREDVGNLAGVGLHLDEFAEPPHPNAIDFLRVESGIHDDIGKEVESSREGSTCRGQSKAGIVAARRLAK